MFNKCCNQYIKGSIDCSTSLNSVFIKYYVWFLLNFFIEYVLGQPNLSVFFYFKTTGHYYTYNIK